MEMKDKASFTFGVSYIQKESKCEGRWIPEKLLSRKSGEDEQKRQ